MQLIANEREVAEQLLKGKHINLSQGKQLFIISKYYFDTLDKEIYNTEKFLKDKVRTLLHEYLKTKSKGNYIWELKESFVRKIIKNSFGVGLIEIKSVPIYKQEIEVIKTLNDIDKEKLIFAMLVESKLKAIIKNSNEYWSNLDSNELAKLANIKKTKQVREKYMNYFMNIGMINIVSRINKIDRQLLFVGGDEVFIKVSMFKDFGLQYEKCILGNKKVIECEKCGKLIYRTGKNNKYCNICSSDIIREKDRKRKENT